MYGRIENGRFVSAPKMLTIGDTHVWNAPASAYAAQGWLPVAFTEAPEAPDGYAYEPGWEQQDGSIVQTWTLAELPPEEMSAEEALEIILGGEAE